MCNNSLSLLIIILYAPENFYTINSLVFIINKFSSNGCSQSGNGSPLTGFALDISASATHSGTSLTHNSGMTFRSWVSIGLTGFVNAIPAGENADQYFDHCSCAGVRPSGPRRTHWFLVATIFSHWFVCSGSIAILIKNKFFHDDRKSESQGSIRVEKEVEKGQLHREYGDSLVVFEETTNSLTVNEH